jgi:hypothetical protein
LAEATVAGIGWSVAGGFTLKREPPHEVTNKRETANKDLIARAKRRRKPSGPTFRSGLGLTIARILHVPRFVCQSATVAFAVPWSNALSGNLRMRWWLAMKELELAVLFPVGLPGK